MVMRDGDCMQLWVFKTIANTPFLSWRGGSSIEFACELRCKSSQNQRALAQMLLTMDYVPFRVRGFSKQCMSLFGVSMTWATTRQVSLLGLTAADP